MAAGKNLGSQVQGSPLSLGGDFPEIKLIVQYWYEGIATTKYSFYPLLRINPCSLSSPSLPLSLSLACFLACLPCPLSVSNHVPAVQNGASTSPQDTRCNDRHDESIINTRYAQSPIGLSFFSLNSHIVSSTFRRPQRLASFPNYHNRFPPSLPLSLSLFLLFGKKKFLKNASVLYRPATSYDNFQ